MYTLVSIDTEYCAAPWEGPVAVGEDSTAVVPSPANGPDGSSSGEPSRRPAVVSQRRFRRLRVIGFRLAQLGPFGVIFASYSILIDYLPSGGFTADWLRSVFAWVCATLVGLVVLVAFQQPAVRRMLVPDPPLQPDPADPAGPAPPGPAVRPPAEVAEPQVLRRSSGTAPASSVYEIMAGGRHRLLASLRDGVHGDTRVRGWPQFLDGDSPPGAVGSAYGLRLALALDIRDPRLEVAEVIRSVLAMQHPGGGWAARPQRADVARPEITAFVLPALIRAGLDTGTRTALVARFGELLDPVADPGLALTTVITTSLSALADVDPSSARVAQLAEQLEHGAQIVPDRTPLQFGWGRWADGRVAGPSVPHTARTVVALARADQVAPDPSGRRARYIAAGAEWLRHHADYEYLDEQVNRPAGEGTDAVVVGHFTPAWVARALIMAGDEDDLNRVRSAVRAVLDCQIDGVWRRRNSDLEPIWMMYQGVAVLQGYSLRNLPWPP